MIWGGVEKKDRWGEEHFFASYERQTPTTVVREEVKRAHKSVPDVE